MDLKKDIFPIFIVAAIVGMVGFMWLTGFPWGIILTMVLLGVAFGIAEIACKGITGLSVSQQFWKWANVTKEGPNKYVSCPNCKTEIVFPNRKLANTFSVIFIMVIVVVTVGHLLWK